MTAVTDADAGDELELVRHETVVDGKNYLLAQVRALVTDSALPGLTFSDESVSVDEGETATFTVVPASEPLADLIIVPVSSNTEAVTVSPDSLTFTVGTNGNWETPQNVTVTGVDDDDEFDDFAVIHHGTVYNGKVYSLGSVVVTVSDGNRAPFFEEGFKATRSVPENSIEEWTLGTPLPLRTLTGMS